MPLQIRDADLAIGDSSGIGESGTIQFTLRKQHGENGLAARLIRGLGEFQIGFLEWHKRIAVESNTLFGLSPLRVRRANTFDDTLLGSLISLLQFTRAELRLEYLALRRIVVQGGLAAPISPALLAVRNVQVIEAGTSTVTPAGPSTCSPRGTSNKWKSSARMCARGSCMI